MPNRIKKPFPISVCRFSGAIDNTNDRLQQYADGRKQVTFVDCHEVFLTDNPRVSLHESKQGA